MWSLGPSRPVFIDGRTDFYESAGVLQDYFALSQARLTAPLLIDQYDLDAFLLPRKNSPLATLLVASGLWKKACEDEVAVLYVRRSPLPRPESSPQPVLAYAPVASLPPSETSFVPKK